MDENLHHRHLGEGERTICAGRYATAKGGRKPSQVATVNDGQDDSQVNSRQVGENSSPTITAAAEKFGVSERDVSRAKVILANGTPALQEAVADDTLSVSDAAKVASEPPKIQNAAVDAVRNGQAKSASGAAKKAKEKSTPKPPKSGKPVFDDRKVTDAFALLVRLLGHRKDAKGDSRERETCMDRLNEALAAFRRWQGGDSC
jgi:hypothetical protein